MLFIDKLWTCQVVTAQLSEKVGVIVTFLFIELVTK